MLRHSRVVLAGLPVAGIALFSLCNLSLVTIICTRRSTRREPADARGERAAALRGVGCGLRHDRAPGARCRPTGWFAWQAGCAERYDVCQVWLTEPDGRQPADGCGSTTRGGAGRFGPRVEHAGQRASLVEGQVASCCDASPLARCRDASSWRRSSPADACRSKSTGCRCFAPRCGGLARLRLRGSRAGRIAAGFKLGRRDAVVDDRVGALATVAARRPTLLHRSTARRA